MRFFVTFLMLFLSSVAYGQNKVDLNNVSKMVSQRQHIKALESVAPCLRANSVKEISNLEECLYIGEEVAIKARKKIPCPAAALIARLGHRNSVRRHARRRCGGAHRLER